VTRIEGRTSFARRPRHLTWAIHSTAMDVRGDENITSDRDRTIVHWVWEFQPREACGFSVRLSHSPAADSNSESGPT
jgi:hypothetical protein